MPIMYPDLACTGRRVGLRMTVPESRHRPQASAACDSASPFGSGTTPYLRRLRPAPPSPLVPPAAKDPAGPEEAVADRAHDDRRAEVRALAAAEAAALLQD